MRMLVKVFPFKIQTVQTDNGTEFTYKYISDTEECPFDTELRRLGIIVPGNWTAGLKKCVNMV